MKGEERIVVLGAGGKDESGQRNDGIVVLGLSSLLVGLLVSVVQVGRQNVTVGT